MSIRLDRFHERVLALQAHNLLMIYIKKSRIVERRYGHEEKK